ncbi:MAG: S1C family serine protease [Opitutaceae bacterium]
MLSRLVRVFVFAVVCVQSALASSADALALQQRLVQVFEQNKGAIVRVKAAYAGPEKDGKKQVMLRVGTGFFISKEGHVLVSASRAAGADRVWVEHQGKSYATEPVGHDRLTNISVLKVIQPPANFSIIAIDTTVERPALGAIAVAISCPLDFDPSPAMGIFSGAEKKLGNKIFPTEYIRTSISVKAGQGGCPILDINGRFIGMTVASVPDLDGSYCLPADALARVRDDLLFSGHIIHSWMGFEVKSLLNDDNSHAVTLSKVIEEAPAALAGLQEGDRLISIGGREILSVEDVPGAVFFTRANQFASIQVLRGDEPLEVSVKTLPRPEKDAVIAASDVAETQAAKASDKSQLEGFFDWTSGGEPKSHKFSRRTEQLDNKKTPVLSDEE